MKDVKKCVCVMIIDVCINISESHMAGFPCGILCMSVYECIFICIVVWDCRQIGVT